MLKLVPAFFPEIFNTIRKEEYTKKAVGFAVCGLEEFPKSIQWF